MKNYRIKKLVGSITILLFGAGYSFADKIVLEYDKAGNRISRKHVIDTRSFDLENKENLPGKMIDEPVSIEQKSLGGILEIQIKDFNPSGSCSAEIFSISGRHIVSVPVKETNAIIDISYLDEGIYIVSINYNGNIYSWKIIK